MSRIVVRTPQGSSHAMALPYEGVVRLGSSPSCELTLDDPDVAPRHCALKCAGGKVGLIVTGAGAEVSVNGDRVRRKVLEEGDLIRLGQSEIRVYIDARDPFLGTTLAGYRIEQRLGRGAMGTVYRAKQLSLDRTVALKILSPRFTNDAAFVRAFLKEARAVARLTHPKVVHVHDAGQADGRFYFSMEYLPGGTLEDRLRQGGALPLEPSLRYALDAAEALAWAEEQGIVHRDVKPGNLLLAADGTVKLGDLGIAVDLSSGPDARPSRRAGSPAYMAPEQARGGAIDHRADVYGLGSTLFHLLTGKLPFPQSATAEVVKAKVAGDPPRLESVRPDVPPAVSDLVRKMMARDPRRRFSTCREMRDAIETALDRVCGRVAATAGRDRETATSRGEEGGVRSKLRMVLAAALLIVAGAGIWTWMRPGGGHDHEVSAKKEDLAVSRVSEESGTAGNESPVRESRERGGGEVDEHETGGLEKRDAEEEEGDDETALAPEAATPNGDERPEPAVDPEIERRQVRVLRELGTIRRDWRAGVLDKGAALELIRKFQARHPEPAFAGAITRVLGEIADSVSKETRKLVDQELEVVIQPLREHRAFSRAADRLRALLERFPEHAGFIQGELKEVEAASERSWANTRAEIESSLESGDFESARRSLTRMETALPSSFDTRIQEGRAAVGSAEDRYWRAAARLYPLELELEAAISRAELEKARGAVRRMSPVLGDSVSDRILAARQSRLLEDIEACEAAWSLLESGIERLSDAGQTVRLRRSDEPEKATVAARLRSLRETELSFRPLDEYRSESVELLSLSDESLLTLILAGAKAGAKKEVAALEALGVLLLHARGPLRAADLLGDSRLSPERQAEYRNRLPTETGHFLGRRVHALQREEERLRKESGERQAGVDVRAWKGVARRALGTILDYRESAAYRRVRGALAGVYLESAGHVLRRNAPRGLFHAARLEDRDGKIEVHYRFREPRELRDFTPVGADSSLEPGSTGVRIQGEVRFVRGQPFRGRLLVEVWVGSEGYDADSPNINIALWTHEEDQVTARPDEARSAAPGRQEPPPGYAVLGVGYRTRAGEALEVPGLATRRVRTPADVFLVGRRGARLNTFPSRECIWASSTPGRLRGPQSISISMTARTLIWKVNGEIRPLRHSSEFDRFYREEPYAGSVTLFTNGSTVEYSRLTITGELDPRWIEQEIEARALEALREVEPEYPFAG